MQTSAYEHFNDTICIWLICRICTALHTKCCGAVSALRPNQYKAIKSFLEGKDVFVTLPTESGKSLCYAIFAFDDMYSHVGSIALIVSPLKALMKDQVSPLVATLMVI